MSTDTTNKDISPVGDRFCYKAACGKLLVQRPRESDSKFLKRRHCDQSCSRTNPLIHSGHLEIHERKREAHKKTCAACGEKFSRRRNESIDVFDQRETCSVKCGNLKRVEERDEEIRKNSKQCVICNKPFFRRKGSETRARFATRETCSNDCGSKKRHQTMGIEPRAKTTAKTKEKAKEEHSLPPVTPLTRKIPDAPKAPPLPVWRPESWKGMRDVRPQVERAS